MLSAPALAAPVAAPAKVKMEGGPAAAPAKNDGAPASVTVKLEGAPAAAPVADDFVGLSFETELLLPDAKGHRYFSPDNKALMSVFKSLGIKSLRIGGNTA